MYRVSFLVFFSPALLPNCSRILNSFFFPFCLEAFIDSFGKIKISAFHLKLAARPSELHFLTLSMFGLWSRLRHESKIQLFTLTGTRGTKIKAWLFLNRILKNNSQRLRLWFLNVTWNFRAKGVCIQPYFRYNITMAM